MAEHLEFSRSDSSWQTQAGHCWCEKGDALQAEFRGRA